MDLRALAKSSFLYAVGSLALRVVGFLMIPVYTRFLTTADYGVIELIDLVVTVAAISFGLSAMGAALIRIYHDRKDPEWQNSVISSGILGMSAVALAICGIGIAAAPWLSEWALGSREYATLLQATFAALVSSNLVEICLTYLRIKDRPLHFVLFSIAHLVLTASLNIYFIVYLDYGVWGFVFSKLISSWLGALYLLTTILRETGVKWNGEAVRRMARFGSPIVFASLASFGIHFLDRFVLRHYASLGTVGIYSLAYKFGFMITYLVGGPFHRAWNARLYSHTDEEGWKQKFADVLRVFAFFLLFAWVGMSTLIDEALVVMAAPAYHPAIVFVPWIALAYASRAIGDFFRTILYINKRSGLAAKIAVSCAILNTGLNFALIPSWGAWGATWATLATWAYFMFVTGRLAQREHHLPVPYRPIVTMLAIAFGLYGASQLATAGPLALRAALSLGLALLFPPLAWLLGGFTPSQKETLRTAVHRFRNRRRQEPAAADAPPLAREPVEEG